MYMSISYYFICTFPILLHTFIYYIFVTHFIMHIHSTFAVTDAINISTFTFEVFILLNGKAYRFE